MINLPVVRFIGLLIIVTDLPLIEMTFQLFRLCIPCSLFGSNTVAAQSHQISYHKVL